MKATQEGILRRLREIPPLPDVAVKVLSMVGDPDFSMNRLVEVVRLDQGLTAKLLRLSNSAYIGLSRKVDSVRDAMQVLGTDTVRRVVVLSCTCDALQQELKGYRLLRGELWQHSVAVASGSQRIAQKAGGVLPAAAFTAGLLHDLGKLALDTLVEREYQEIDARVRNEGRSFLKAEEAALGMSHATVGARLAEQWQLPPYVPVVIRCHHEPATAGEHRRIASVVHLANALAVMSGIGVGADGLAYELDPTIMEYLGLDERFVQSMSISLLEDLELARQVLALH